MAFGAGPGLITDGIGADSYKAGIPAIFQTPAGQQVQAGATLKRGILSVVGRNDAYTQYSQGDQVVTATNPGSGFVAGVVLNNTRQNLQNSNATPLGVKLFLARQGVAPVRVAAVNGGTAVTIGSMVGFSAAIGASTQDIPTVQGSYVVGAMVGIVTAYQITTATVGSVTAAGSQTVTVLNTDGITTVTAITVDPAQPNQETVTPTAVTAQVRASGSITLGGTISAGTVLLATINGVPVSYTVQASDTTLTIAAASFAKAINASLAVAGINPSVLPAQSAGAVVYLTALPAGTGGNAYTLAVTATGGTTTAAASGSTLAGGSYGTVTANFSYTHGGGAVILGQNIVSGATLVPVPAATGGINVDTVLVDVALVGA
jgi:hypothetical protein